MNQNLDSSHSNAIGDQGLENGSEEQEQRSRHDHHHG